MTTVKKAERLSSSSSSGGHVVRDVQHPTGEMPVHIRLLDEYEKLTGVRLEPFKVKVKYVCRGYPDQCQNCDCKGPGSEITTSDEDEEDEEEKVGCAQEENGKYVCPGYPDCENMDCDLCEDPETEDEDVKEDEEKVGCAQEESAGDAGDAGAQGATSDAGGDAGDGTARPKPSKRWKLLVPSNFPRRSQPYKNNAHWYTKYDMVLTPEPLAKGFMPGHSGGKGFKVRRDDEPLLEVEEDRRALQLALHGSGTTRMGVTNTNTPWRRKSERAGSRPTSHRA